MEENGTKGIRNPDEGFQPVTQELGVDKTSRQNSLDMSGGDRLGIKHWPGLFKYLEDHFAFSASLLSIAGYVIIAAFGAIQTLGQYLAYILFLCGVAVVYNFDKIEKNRKWLYAAVVLIAILLVCVLFFTWNYVVLSYHWFDNLFQMKLSPSLS